MGLDCSHGCWHGAYSAFMRWRAKLARTRLSKFGSFGSKLAIVVPPIIILGLVAHLLTH